MIVVSFCRILISLEYNQECRKRMTPESERFVMLYGCRLFLVPTLSVGTFLINWGPAPKPPAEKEQPPQLTQTF